MFFSDSKSCKAWLLPINLILYNKEHDVVGLPSSSDSCNDLPDYS